MIYLLFAFFIGLWLNSCNSHSQTTPPPSPVASIAAGYSDSSGRVNFDSEVLPILTTHCNPCHFPGGKMYEKMPFDQATTLTSHATGIIKRIKGDNEVAILRRFIEETRQ
jgi:hypothetical protein